MMPRPLAAAALLLACGGVALAQQASAMVLYGEIKMNQQKCLFSLNDRGVLEERHGGVK